MQRAADARAAQRSLGPVFLADGHEAGHLRLGDGDFLAAPVGKAHVLDRIVGGWLGGGSTIGGFRCSTHVGPCMVGNSDAPAGTPVGAADSRARRLLQRRYKDFFMPFPAAATRALGELPPRLGVTHAPAAGQERPCQRRRSSISSFLPRSTRFPSLPRPRTNARAARSTSTQRRRCRARGADRRKSCWSASSPATRKTSPASRSSAPP